MSDLLEFRGISGHPNFDHFRRNGSFSTPRGFINNCARLPLQCSRKTAGMDMKVGRIGPLGIWDKFDERWIGTRVAARWFLVATLFVLTTLPLFIGKPSPSGALGKAYGAVAGIGGAISIFYLWIGMWKYWARLDESGRWSKRFWFAVMLAGFWYGSCLYCWCIYLPQVMRSARQGVAPPVIELRSGKKVVFGKFLLAAWLCFVLLLVLIFVFPKFAV